MLFNILNMIKTRVQSPVVVRQVGADIRNLIESSFAKPGTKILFLGDSTYLRTADDDADKRSLDLLVAQALGAQAIKVAGTAYHVELFQAVLNALPDQAQFPRAIVICINVRSFLPQWRLNPAWAYTDIANCITNNSASGLQLPMPKHLAVDEYEKTNVFLEGIGERTIAEYRMLAHCEPRTAMQRRLRLQIIFGMHYAVPIGRNNERLVALRSLVTSAKKLACPILLYVTPVNYEGLKEHAGTEGESVFNANLQMLRETVAAHEGDRIRFQEYARLLNRDCFFSPDIANEHLNEKGRALLADRLVVGLTDMLKSKELV